MDMIRQSEY